MIWLGLTHDFSGLGLWLPGVYDMSRPGLTCKVFLETKLIILHVVDAVCFIITEQTAIFALVSLYA